MTWEKLVNQLGSGTGSRTCGSYTDVKVAQERLIYPEMLVFILNNYFACPASQQNYLDMTKYVQKPGLL